MIVRNIIVILILLYSFPTLASAVDDAYKLCYAIDKTGFSSQPCEVSGWNSTITAFFDMQSSEARKFCENIPALKNQLDLNIMSPWKLLIVSPYSNGNTIAQCSF